MSVIQLDNGEVHNIYELRDIKEFVDREVYDFIEENTIELKDDYEDINELYGEIDNLKGEVSSLEDSSDYCYNKLDDLYECIDDFNREEIKKQIKNCMNMLS